MTICGKERWEEWEAIFEGIEGLIALYEEDPESRGLNAYFQGFKKYTEDIFRAIDERIPVIWHNCGMTPELIKALDGPVFPYAIESFAVLEDLVGDVQYTMDVIDAAEAHGLAPEVCSIDKSALGAALSKIVPDPLSMVFHNTPCDSQIAVSQTLMEVTGKDSLLIDIPYLGGEREISYVAEQLKQEIAFLEEATGYRFSLEKLRAISEKNNEMSEYLLSWNEARRTVPCPQISKLVGLMTALLVVFSGDDIGVYIARELMEEAVERKERGESAVVGAREIRAVWYQDPIWFDLSFYDWLEAELGVVIPMDLFGYFAPEGFIDTSSFETMLYGLARKYIRTLPMSRQFKGPIDVFIDDYLKMYQDFTADFGVFAGHIACKHGWGGIGLFREESRRAGYPLLVFEFDMFDPRIASSEEVAEQFSRFVNDVVIPRREG
jgi:benzoyl-CoA reductase/2-hydroxyglutaryl-CoA dehydratase subunit BcrC/BadD/HgdB